MKKRDLQSAAAILGRNGGRKRAQNLSPAQRSAIARKGGAAKAAKAKAKEQAA